MKITRSRTIGRLLIAAATVAVLVSCSLDARRATSPPTGLATLNVGRHTTSVQFMSRGESREFIPQKGRLKLEPGSYLLEGWRIDRKDAAGRTWTMKAGRPPNPVTIEIAAGEERELPIGASLKTAPAIRRQGRSSTIFPTLTAGNGEHVDLKVDGKQVSPPPVRIFNSDKSYDRTFKFEYG